MTSADRLGRVNQVPRASWFAAGPGADQAGSLWSMVAVSLAIHTLVVVVALVGPWRFFARERPQLVSYTVDLVASDRLGGSAAPRSEPGAKPGVALPAPPPKPQARVEAQPASKEPAQPKAPPPPRPAPKGQPAAVQKAPPAPKPKPRAKPEPEPKAEPKPKPKPKPESKPAAPPKPEPKKEPKKEPKPAAPPKPEVPPKAKPQPDPQPKPPAAQRAVAPVADPAPAPEKSASQPQEPEIDPSAARAASAAELRDHHLAAAIERSAVSWAVGVDADDGTGLGGSGGGGVVHGLDFLLYKGVVENEIRQNWAWAGRATDLRALVGFGIQSDGAVTDVEILESSGDPTYDALAIRAVESSDPLPAPPEAYRAEFARYELELRAEDGSR